MEKEIKSVINEAKQGEMEIQDSGDTDIKVYGKLADQKIKENWRYPLLKNSNLISEVEITIGRDGNIISYKLTKSSGNQLFDNSVIKAILETKKLPPPPIGEKEIKVYIQFIGKRMP